MPTIDSQIASTSLPAQSGILLVGHGTQDLLGTQEFNLLADSLQHLIAPIPVAHCSLEFQQPTISQAWDQLARLGVQHIRVVPLLLFAAGHAKQDIPVAVRNAAALTSGITFDQAEPLGCQANIVDLVQKRLASTLNTASQASATRIETDRPDLTLVIMVGRGNRDVSAQAEMAALVELTQKSFLQFDFSTAYYAMAEPRLEDVLFEAISSDRYKTIIIQPHLLFAGRIYDAIKQRVATARTNHPQITFCVSDYLGPDQLVAHAVRCNLLS